MRVEAEPMVSRNRAERAASIPRIEDIIFQHSNDPKHTANLTKDWLLIMEWLSLIGLHNLQT